MSKRMSMVLLLSALALGVGGCYQSPDVSLHEPGVYKGRKDPLLALEGSSEQQQRLLDRFNMVQTDR